jgi:hypothetical protein
VKELSNDIYEREDVFPESRHRILEFEAIVSKSEEVV